MSSPTRFDTVVHHGVVASTGAALIAGAVNDWPVVVMARAVRSHRAVAGCALRHCLRRRRGRTEPRQRRDLGGDAAENGTGQGANRRWHRPQCKVQDDRVADRCLV